MLIASIARIAWQVERESLIIKPQSLIIILHLKKESRSSLYIGSTPRWLSLSLMSIVFRGKLGVLHIIKRREPEGSLV